MNDTTYNIFQIQCQSLAITLALAEREYLRYPPGMIVDGLNVGGQFATGKKSGSNQAKEPIAIEPKSLMGNVAKSLEKVFAQGKGLEARVGHVVNQISNEITAQYGIKPEPITQPEKTFIEKLQEAATKYKLIEAQIPKATSVKQKTLLEDLIKAAIPLAVAASLTVGAEVAIGLFLGQTVGELLIGSAISLGVSVGVDKTLDLAKVENPIVRAGLQLAAGVATGGIVSKVAKASALSFGKFSETAKDFIEQATAVPGIRSKIKNPYRTATVLDKYNIDSQKVLDALYREVEQEKRIDPRMRNPHTFSKRLDEYVDLSMERNKNKTVIGLEWRRGIIDAELKYGEHLERIHQISPAQVFLPSTKSEKTYQNFLKSISASKNNRTKTQVVDRAFANERLLGEGKFVLKGNKTINKYPINIEARLAEVHQEVENALRLSSAKLHDTFVGYFEPKLQKGTHGDEGSRGYAIQLQRGTETVNYIQSGLFGRPRELAFHEVGHFIEDANKMAQTSVDYILSRKKEGKLSLIDNREVVSTDFINQYTGKTYGELGNEDATEVVSMGLQNLADLFGVQRAVREDIDHLRYTLFALDSVIN